MLAFMLRILLGIFLTWALPRFGYAEQVQQAGYYYADAFTRDGQAWHLAGSGLSLWRVFNREFMSDQYGGLLFLSGLIYRLFSPDAHRPYLMILMSAGASALGIPFLISAIQKKFSNQTALIAGWIVCLFPDSLLLGASQMREPYLISLFAVSFWAVVRLVEQKVDWKSLVGLALGVTGLFLFSYRVALPVLGALLVWEWVADRYSSYSRGVVSNPQGPSTGDYLVLRGGSWYYSVRLLRASSRLIRSPDFTVSSGGFRCATSEQP